MGNFLLGFGIGITAAVLFAPKSGPESREYLGSKASDGTDYLLKQGQQLKDSAADLLDRGKNVVMNQKDKLMGTAEQVSQAYQA
ncbi:MAG: YtxH domain-containing protein [Acidobacteriota bacterium]|nr:YtxH domain-containing protein [Acidobacteriota bacterium]